MPSNLADALILAKDTARVAFAPNLLLFSVPSRLINSLSIITCSKSLPTKLSLIIVLMLLTAFNTPLPWNLLGSLSRNSKASRDPVEAPLGTDAVAVRPLSKMMVASTVGFPLLSNISLPIKFVIFAILLHLFIIISKN